jgi:hypothetical protein
VGVVLGASLALYLAYLVRCELVPSEDRCFAQDPVGMDFVIVWTASVLDARGSPLRILRAPAFYKAQTDLVGHHYQVRLWSYPPHYLLLLRPLSRLPYLPAYAAWCLGLLTLYLLAFATGTRRGWMLVALALAPATFVSIVTGQNGLLLGALLVGGLSIVDARPRLAGVLFGLATVKPQLGLLVPVLLLATRSWRTLTTAAATGGALLAASLWIHGIRMWEVYLAVTAPNSVLVMESGGGFFTWMVPSPFMSGRILGWSLPVAYGLQGLVTCVALVATYWGCRRTERWELRGALVGIGTFLASPYAFNYDMTLLSAAVLWLAARGLEVGFLPCERVGLLLLWILPLAIVPLGYLGAPIAPLVLAASFVGLLARIELERRS